MKEYFFDNSVVEHFHESRDVDLSTSQKLSCLALPALSHLKASACPYCNARLETIQWFFDSGAQAYDEIDCSSSVCNQCGFWYHKHYVDSNGVEVDSVRMASLQRFNIADKAAPHSAIVNWVNRHYNDAFRIDPRRLELLVRDILREHLSCDICITAQTRDGGIDLYSFDGTGGKFIVEVKRYKERNKIGVSFVRELAGVLVRENACHGMIVSTSDFSEDAMREAQTLRDPRQKTPIEIELRTLRELLSWMNILNTTSDYDTLSKYWERIIRRVTMDDFVTWRDYERLKQVSRNAA